MVERWKLAPDAQTVDVTVFVEDPGAFTMPWTAVQRWRRVENAPILPGPVQREQRRFLQPRPGAAAGSHQGGFLMLSAAAIGEAWSAGVPPAF